MKPEKASKQSCKEREHGRWHIAFFVPSGKPDSSVQPPAKRMRALHTGLTAQWQGVCGRNRPGFRLDTGWPTEVFTEASNAAMLLESMRARPSRRGPCSATPGRPSPWSPRLRHGVCRRCSSRQCTGWRWNRHQHKAAAPIPNVLNGDMGHRQTKRSDLDIAPGVVFVSPQHIGSIPKKRQDFQANRESGGIRAATRGGFPER